MKILTDIKREEARLASAGEFDAEQEILNTIIPLIKGLASESRQEFSNVAEAMEEIFELVDEVDNEEEHPLEELSPIVVKTLGLAIELLDKSNPEDEVDLTTDYGKKLVAFYEVANRIRGVLLEMNAPEEPSQDDIDDLLDESTNDPSDKDLDDIEEELDDSGEEESS